MPVYQVWRNESQGLKINVVQDELNPSCVHKPYFFDCMVKYYALCVPVILYVCISGDTHLSI